jgi:hypothetical protein
MPLPDESAGVLRNLRFDAEGRPGHRISAIPPLLHPSYQNGAGVREIRVREDSGPYRVLYVAKFEDRIRLILLPEKDAGYIQARH